VAVMWWRMIHSLLNSDFSLLITYISLPCKILELEKELDYSYTESRNL